MDIRSAMWYNALCECKVEHVLMKKVPQRNSGKKDCRNGKKDCRSEGKRNETKAQPNDGGVQVIARAASVLRLLQEHPEGLGFSRIAKEIALPRSTVYRIACALEAEKLVTASSEGIVQLGSGLVPLARAVTRDWRRALRPYLEELFVQVNETVDLAILEDDHALFVDQMAAPHRLQAVSRVGISFPLYCTASGKAILAELPDAEIERLLPERLLAFTPSTITTRTRLMEELERVKSECIAYDREEHTVGIAAVGISIRNARGDIAAISIPVPSVRFYGNEKKLASALLNTRVRIQQRFDPT